MVRRTNMYTVKELIEALKQCPEDYEVVMNITSYALSASIDVVGIDHKDKVVDLFSE
jgi:hypothetical protein